MMNECGCEMDGSGLKLLFDGRTRLKGSETVTHHGVGTRLVAWEESTFSMKYDWRSEVG